MTSRLVIDVETASAIDLPSAGAERYAEDPTTRVLCVGYQFDQDAPRIWVPGDPIPAVEVNSTQTFVAHNAAFELAIWRHCLTPLGWPYVPDLKRWSCTMARSAYHGLPQALEGVAQALRFPPSMQKDAAGRRIMLQLSKPRSLVPLRWWHEADQMKFQALCRYCVRDVEIEATLDRMLPELPAVEHELWRINQVMNEEGVALDLDLIERLGQIVQQETRRLNQNLAQATQGKLRSVSAVGQIRSHLEAAEGVKLDVLDRDTVSRVLASDPFLTPGAERILAIRAEAAKTSTAKLVAMRRSISADGRGRGLFRYYGASRTGRYSSQRIQLQNLARPTIKDPEVAIDLVKHHDANGDVLNLLFSDTAMGVVSSCLRGCLTARDGHLLAVADLAQIEARVIAWLAGQGDVLSVFASGEDVYSWTARQVGSDNRQLGKVMVLALGFGMGVKRFVTTAAGYHISVDDHTAQHLVTAWREANQEIVSFWWELERAALAVAGAASGHTERVGCLTLRRSRRAMAITLPSGRELFYQFIDREWTETVNGRKRLQLVYEGINQFTRRWELLRAWPGKLAENVTQAVARDVLVESLRNLYRRGINVIGTVHDELIVEAPVAAARMQLDLMLDAMRRAPSWAGGLPVHAEGWIGERYRK